MREINGGEIERPAMDEEKKNTPRHVQPGDQAEQTTRSHIQFDRQTERLLSQLHPEVAALAREHLIRIVEADTGYEVKITKTYRSYGEQQKEYAKGRFGNPGPTVTRARPGESPHNFGAGYDIAFIDPKTKKVVADPNDSAYQTAGRIGEELGLTWGMHFPDRDAVHFELSETRGVDIPTMRKRHESGKDLYTGE
jgi:peptidoglycan L-alanyl-D-glutamate endopeptidase CwlK